MYNKKSGFTLTEVIVVIVIIAALAIILIPNMLSLMPDDHNIKYKKAFYTIQEIVNDIASECQGLEWNTGDGGYWDDASNPDNVLNYCYSNSTPPEILYLADEICDRLNSTSDCSSAVTSHVGKIQTTNNMYWYIPKNALAGSTDLLGSSATIYVNVDGKELTSAVTSDSDDTLHNNGTYKINISNTGKVTAPSEAETNYLLKNPTED